MEDKALPPDPLDRGIVGEPLGRMFCGWGGTAISAFGAASLEHGAIAVEHGAIAGYPPKLGQTIGIKVVKPSKIFGIHLRPNIFRQIFM